MDNSKWLKTHVIEVSSLQRGIIANITGKKFFQNMKMTTTNPRTTRSPKHRKHEENSSISLESSDK